MNKKLGFGSIGLALLLAFGFMSCESDKDDVVEPTNPIELQTVNAQYVDGVVLPTYKSLSDASIELYKAIEILKDNKTDENVAKVATLWKSTRVFWEESEAFLFGPVDGLGIDPHIDTWPMVETAFNSIITNATWIEKLNSVDGDKYVSSTSDGEDGILGFHSIEYIIFRDGKVRAASTISANELIFIKAVAGDLRNQCCLIEAGWLGINNIGSEKAAYVQRTSNYSELGNQYPTPYATTMKTTPNSIYTATIGSTRAILDGAIEIANEVATQKIGKPYNGASQEDKNYIESKYSYNSKVDFAGNIRSIRNAYLGEINYAGNITASAPVSVSSYLKVNNATIDNEVKAAIDDAIAKIEAMENFEQNSVSANTKAAMDATLTLLAKLEKAKAAL